MLEKQILIVTSVDAEKEAILKGIHSQHHIDVITVGVGIAKAAANTAIALSKKNYDLVINMGIGGGFAPYAEIGSIVIADSIICADLGSETPDGFLSVDELGFGSSIYTVDSSLVNKIYSALKQAGLQVTVGEILTVSTTTGTQKTLQKWQRRFPHAAAEAMEGFGVSAACSEFQIPCLEIRAISNMVGPRNRDLWRIGDALKMLQLASPILQEVL